MLSTLFMIQLISNNGVNRRIITQAWRLIFTCFSRVIKILVLHMICLNCDIWHTEYNQKANPFGLYNIFIHSSHLEYYQKANPFGLYNIFIHSRHLEYYQKANPFLLYNLFIHSGHLECLHKANCFWLYNLFIHSG